MNRRYDYHNALSNVQLGSTSDKALQQDLQLQKRNPSMKKSSCAKGNEYVRQAQRSAYFDKSRQIRRPKHYFPLSKHSEQKGGISEDNTLKCQGQAKRDQLVSEKEPQYNCQIYLAQAKTAGAKTIKYSQWKRQEVTFTLDNLSKIEEKDTFVSQELLTESNKNSITPVKHYALIDTVSPMKITPIQRIPREVSKSKIFQKKQKQWVTPHKIDFGFLTENKGKQPEPSQTKRIGTIMRKIQQYTLPDDNQKQNCIYNMDFKIEEPSKVKPKNGHYIWQNYKPAQSQINHEHKFPCRSRHKLQQRSIDKGKNESPSNRSVSRGKLTVVTRSSRGKQLQLYR